MKISRCGTNTLQMELGHQEQKPFLALLNLYPVLPAAHQPLSRNSKLPDAPLSQQLLNEALAEQHQQSKTQLQKLLADPAHFQVDKTGCRLTLSQEEAEWMLQVLNDIRVGAWALLGSPEQLPETVTEENAAHVWAMETAGFLQMSLLEALNSQ